MKSVKATIERTDVEKLLEILGEKSPVGVCIMQDGKICYFNSNFPIAIGYTADELVGKDSLGIVVPEDREMVRENTIKMLKGELLSPYQFRVIHKDGSIRWVMSAVKSIQYHGRRAVLGNYMEITERKQTEESLQAEKNKLQSLVDAMEHGLTIQDTEYNIIYQNGSGKRDWGDHLGEKCYRVYEGREKVCDGCPVEKAFKDGKSHTAVRRTVLPSGEVVFWENTANPVRDAQGSVVACLEIANNITERKQAEEALKENEQKYRELANSITDIFFAMDEHLRYTYWNRASEILTGIQVDDALGKSLREIFPDTPSLRKVEKVYRKVLRTQQPQTFVNDFDIKGKHYIFEISAYPSRGGISVFVKNITERKQTRDRLEESEQKYRLLFETSLDCINQLDREGRYLAANPATARSLGVPLEGLIGKTVFEVMTQEVAQRRLRDVRKVLDEWQPQVFEDERAGRYFHHIVIPTKISEQKEAVQVITRDITERREMEESLRQGEEKYRELFNSAVVGMVVLDAETMKVVMVNQAALNMFGFSSIDEAIVLNPMDFIVPKDRERALEITMKDLFEQGSQQAYEFRAVTKDGREIWISTTAARIMHEGRLAALISFADITERKQAEEALRRSEERYRTILEEMEDAYFEVDLGGHFTFVNNSVCRDLGYSREELIGMSYKGFTVEEDIESVFRVFNEVYRTGVPNKGFPWKTIRKDGVQGFAETSISPLPNDKGEIIGFRGVGRDVTERKQADETLRRSEERYRTILEEMEDAYFEVDLGGHFTFVNNSVCRDLGYSREELIGMSYKGFTVEEDIESVFRVFNEVYRTGAPNKGFPWNIIRKDGSQGFAETSVTPMRNNKGEIIGFRGVGRDVTERRKIMEALQQSEENYRALFNSSVIGMFVMDAETLKMVMCNQAAAKMFGFSSAEETIGVNPLDFVLTKDKEKAIEITRKEMFEQDLRQVHEFRVATKDGRQGWVSTVGARIIHEGRLAGLVSMIDINSRKQAEWALRQSEENYRALFDSSVIGTIVLDAETMKVVMGNQAAAEMFGFSSVEEAIGINPLDFVPPEDRERDLEIVTKELFEQDLRTTHELRAITKDGRKRWISITGARIMHGGRLAGLLCFTDITERKQAEEALRQSEENYRVLFDSSVIGTIVLDAETMKVAMVNQAAAKMFGFNSAEEALGTDPLVFIRPDDREKILEIAVKALFEQDSREVYELGAVTKDGREIWINATGARIMHKGKLAGLISFTDITEEKLHRERYMMADRLVALGELAAGTAHELNNPLTSIVGFSQLLIEREVPDDIREDLKLINNEAQRAARVTKNLLTFARKHAPMKQRIQINSIIDDVLRVRAHEHVTNGIDVKQQLATNLPEIMVDYFQMQQVLINIVINAEYFMTEAHNGGTLTVTTKKQNNTVMISFADDGPGIPPENLGRIFDPFFTTKEAGKGTGLGLSICHGIVVEHGGQIYAKSQLGKGTTIFVELPIKER